MKAKDLLSLLCREPLGYQIVRQSGSHRVLEAPDRPRLIFAFHDGATIAPGHVRKILVDQARLGADEIRDIL